MLKIQSETSLTEKPVRIGLVGCGRLAEFGYIPAFRRAPGVALAGIVDIDPSRCRLLAPETPCYDNLQPLIRGKEIDALIVAAPTRFHLEYARCAAEAGLPSLVEKPPGVDTKEAAALLSLTPTPWIGFNRRFEEGVTALKERLHHGQGFQLRLELQYRRATWKPFDMHDDALLDLGPHLIDLARWLTASEVCSVRAQSLGERHAEFELGLRGGKAVVACSTNRPYRERIEIRDTRDGRLLASHRRGGIVSGIMARLRPNSANPLVTSLALELEAFARAVRGRPSGSLASAADGLAVMSTIEAVRRSAAGAGAGVSIRLTEGPI
jgi:predicted dehydrogenase